MGEEEAERSLCEQDVTVHGKNPRELTRRLLERQRGFSQVAGLKVNAQASVVFLKTNNTQLGNVINF